MLPMPSCPNCHSEKACNCGLWVTKKTYKVVKKEPDWKTLYLLLKKAVDAPTIEEYESAMKNHATLRRVCDLS